VINDKAYKPSRKLRIVDKIYDISVFYGRHLLVCEGPFETIEDF